MHFLKKKFPQPSLFSSAIFWGTLLFFFFIAFFPLLFLLKIVVQDWNTLQNPWDWTARQQELFLRTLGLSFQTLFWSFLFGAPPAWFLAKYDFHGKTLVVALLTFPLFVPSYIHAILWTDLFGRKGVCNQWLEAFGCTPWIVTGPSISGAAWVLGISCYPYVFWITYQALLRLDGQIEKSFFLHFRPRDVFWKCYLPLTSPALLGAFLLVFILVSGNFGVPQVLLVQVYSLEIFTQYSVFLNCASATLVSFPLIGICFLLLALLLKTEKIAELYSKQAAPPLFFAKGKFFYLGSCWILLVLTVSFFLPILFLFRQISHQFPLQKALETGGKELWTTFVVSFWTATAITGISCILGNGFVQRKRNPKKMFPLVLNFFCLSSFAFPGILLATGMTRFWIRWDFVYLSVWILIFASIARFAPFGIHIAERLFFRLSRNSQEAALLYGGPLLVWKFSLGRLAQDFGAIWILTYALTFGELDASILVKNPQNIPIGPTILSLLHFGHPEIISVLILLSIILGMIPVILYLLWTEAPVHLY